MTSVPVFLSEGFVPVVSVGNPVQVGHPLARRAGVREEVISIPTNLAVPLSKAKRTIRKSPGESVSIGDVLAVKKTFLGLNTVLLRSKIAGVVLRYERDTGNLVLRIENGSVAGELLSPVDGVVAVCDNGKIVINTDKQAASVTFAIGGSAQGALFILEPSFAESVDEGSLLFQLGAEAIDKIVVGKQFPREVLAKAFGMGALGAIGMEISDEDIAYLSSKFPHVPVLAVGEEVMRKLLDWKGKKVYLDAPSQSLVFLHL
jgi:hypothetical protein